MTPLEANRMRWQREPGHYEVWYATLSHRPSQTGFWIRYTLESPKPGHGAPYAQLWFARFDGRDPSRTFGVNRKFPIAELRAEPSPFRVRIEGSELRQDGLKGEIAGAGHSASWDLRFSPSETLHKHLPELSYKGRWAETQVLSPNLNVHARGTITVDGETYELDGEPLGQTHLWGRKHAYSWAWSHCNAFDGDRGAALETLTIKLRRGSIVLPKLTLISLYLDGEDPNAVEFREWGDLALSRSEFGTGRYHLRAIGGRVKLEGELRGRPDDMIVAEYVDPDGDPAFCHNTCCADARVTVWRRSPFDTRWREWRTLTCEKLAHFEWGARAGDPLVKKRHVTVDGR